jgi:hypothetical protein
MRLRHKLTPLALASSAAFLLALPTGSSAFAPAESAPIHPGVMTETEGAQCTSNFVFTSTSKGKAKKKGKAKRKTTTYLGQAAHCSGTGESTETDGCTSKSLPLGTKVDVDGAKEPGTLAYNSWLTMQGLGETDEETCAYNDLALIKLSPSDAKLVNPSIPSFGGPAGVGDAAAGEKVYTYGNSSLRGGTSELSPKSGSVIDRSPGGWSYDVYTASPGIPGDSGSAFLNAKGEALGVLSTVSIAPLPASNGVGSIAKELAYAKANGMKKLKLVDGTEKFAPGGIG